MRKKHLHGVVIGLVIVLSASLFWTRAQQSSSLVVIEGATLIDGTGGAPIANSVVVIEKDRILQVFRQG